MSAILAIVPNGWPCKLCDAPEGMFVTMEDKDLICFKTEYTSIEGKVVAYNSGGEYFHGKGDEHIVQPVKLERIGQ